jgi:flagellar basal-body rod modification protein FlgD
MTVGATAPTTSTPSAGTPDATLQGLGSLADNFNTFLTLLTTQLKNQDPTAPLDSNQFTQQLVQMTGVEQQLNTNSLLGQLVTNTSGGVSNAVGMIGTDVKATSDTANLTNGQAQWTYTLPAGATDLKVQILDSNGNVVAAQAPTDMSTGDHVVTWNGQNLSGTQLGNGGTYTLKVSATDSTGAALATTSYVEGLVTGVTQNNGTASIVVNGSTVPISSVIAVNKPTTASTTNGSTTGS